MVAALAPFLTMTLHCFRPRKTCHNRHHALPHLTTMTLYTITHTRFRTLSKAVTAYRGT